MRPTNFTPERSAVKSRLARSGTLTSVHHLFIDLCRRRHRLTIWRSSGTVRCGNCSPEPTRPQRWDRSCERSYSAMSASSMPPRHGGWATWPPLAQESRVQVRYEGPRPPPSRQSRRHGNRSSTTSWTMPFRRVRMAQPSPWASSGPGPTRSCMFSTTGRGSRKTSAIVDLTASGARLPPRRATAWAWQSLHSSPWPVGRRPVSRHDRRAASTLPCNLRPLARRGSIPRSWARTSGVRAFTFRRRSVFICSRPPVANCGCVNRLRESFSELLLRKLK